MRNFLGHIGHDYETFSSFLIDEGGAQPVVGGAMPRQIGIRKVAINPVSNVPLSSCPQLPALCSCLTSLKDGLEPGTVR